jgi:hypothetical protein
MTDFQCFAFNALLPRSGNKKREFGLQVAGAARIGATFI